MAPRGDGFRQGKHGAAPRERCASRVKGGTLVITAKDIEEPSFGELTVRITFRTLDGDHKQSLVYNLSLFP